MGVKIRERKPGQWWVFVNHKGNRIAKLAGSLETAEAARQIIEQQIATGIYQFPKREVKKQIPTLAAYYAKFKGSYLKGGVRESTAERYGQCFKHILPKLGDKPLDEISREALKALVAGMVEKDLARYTIRNVIACLCSVLSHAVEDRIITHNPATKLGRYYKQARVVHGRIEPLSEDEVPVFLAAVRERDTKRRLHNPECYPLFLCAVHTGMRAGELAGLQWGDLDWNGKYLIVRRTVKKGKVHPTKTDRIRRIDMSDDLIAELGAYRRRCLEAALKDGRNEIAEWVFASGDGTPRDMHNLERRELGKCLEAAKLRSLRFHDLRHTTASILIQQNAPLAYVKDLLGHSSIKVTVDIYGHLVPGANRQVVNRIPSLNTMTERTAPQAKTN